MNASLVQQLRDMCLADALEADILIVLNNSHVAHEGKVLVLHRELAEVRLQLARAKRQCEMRNYECLSRTNERVMICEQLRGFDLGLTGEGIVVPLASVIKEMA